MSMAAKYAMQKRAKGGCVGPDCKGCGSAMCMAEGGGVSKKRDLLKAMYAEGGEVDMEADYDPEEIPEPKENAAAEDEDMDMIERILAQHFSEGGKVANETEMSADHDPNQFDDLVLRDDLESDYTGENSGDEIGNEQEDEDRDDIVARFMRSKAKKGQMPRPA